MDSVDLTPSEVRERVLEEHDALRGHLSRIRALAARLGAEPSEAEALRDALLELLPLIDAHMDLEDEILVPALQQADAFGDVRTDMVHEHHAHYRAGARVMREQLVSPGLTPEELCALASTLADDLLEEMRDEERRLLDPEILRDSVVTSGVGG